MTLQVGYAQHIITPTLEKKVHLAGFGQNRLAEAVHDDLSARALALVDEKTTLVLCALDLIGFYRAEVLDVQKRLGQLHPEAQVIIASTHTHHGLDTMGLWGPDSEHSGVDPLYMQMLKEVIVQTIDAALSSLYDAPFMRTACVQAPGLAKNVRSPQILDEELTCLQFLTEDGVPLASLFSFPCHPQVLWESNPHITADYPGALRLEVERVTGAGCIFFPGALGGMMTPDVRDHSFEEAQAMGLSLAAAGLGALAEALAVETWQPLVVKHAPVQIRLTNPLFKLAFRRGLLPDIRSPKGEITSEVNLVQIGPLWLATVPGEPLPRLGLQLKAAMRTAGAETAGIISLANDELGYILPQEDFRYPLNPFRPGKHYEETMSPGKEAGPRVLEGILSLL